MYSNYIFYYHNYSVLLVINNNNVVIHVLVLSVQVITVSVNDSEDECHIESDDNDFEDTHEQVFAKGHYTIIV